MSTNSLTGLLSQAASRDNIDLSGISLPDVAELDSFATSPPRRPPLAPSARLNSSTTRHVFSRIPSEATNIPSSLENSQTTLPAQSRLQSFVTELDTPADESGNFSALDTPVRERRPFDEAPNGGQERLRQVSSTGVPRRQMTLREQEKVVDVIKKENFSLQMKVHLLSERLQELTPEHMEQTIQANVKLKMETHSRGVEIKKLKKILLELEKELSEAHERDKENASRPDSAVVKRLETELDHKDDEIRELKKRLRIADAAKQSSLASSVSSPSVKRLQDTNATLAERQAELEDELERNRRHLDEATDELEHLRATLQRQKEDAENDGTRRRLRDLEQQNEDLERQNKSFANALEEYQEDQDILKEENEHLRAELEELDRKRRRDASERSASRAEIMEEREDKEALEQNANELRDKWAAASLELERKEDELDELRDVVDNMDADYQRLLNEHEAEVVDRDARIEILETEKIELQNTLDEVHDKIEKTIEHMHQQIAEKEAEKEAELRAREEEMVAANAEIAALGKRIWELEEDLESEQQALDKLQHDMDEQLEDSERRERALKDKIASKNDQLADIRDKYEECRQQVIAHADRSVQIEQHAQDLADEADVERNGRLKLQDECNKLEDQLDDLDRALRQAEGDRDRLKKELEDTERRRRRDTGELESALHEAQANIDASQKLLAQRDEDIAALQSTLNELESESRKLGESHSTDRFALELELERVRRDLTRAEEDLERVRNDASSRDQRAREREGMIDKLHVENRELATQLASQTQARLNLSEKLDLAQSHAKTTDNELGELRTRYSEIEKRLSKDQRQLQSQENSYRDQLTERNTLLLTIHQYLGKILGADKSPKKGTPPTTRPLTNFAVFHEELMSRMKAISQISADFDVKCKLIEQAFTVKFSELKKQLESRWKQIDRFEAGLKTATEKRDAWKRKLHGKEGELEAAKMSNAEMAAQLSSLKRTGSSGAAELTVAESKGLAVRVSNAERRAAHAVNITLKKDEELLAERQRAKQNEERYIARIKELERKSDHDAEKLKQEKYGSNQAMSALQKDNEALKEQLAQTNRREQQLAALERTKLTSPPSAPEKRSGR